MTNKVGNDKPRNVGTVEGAALPTDRPVRASAPQAVQAETIRPEITGEAKLRARYGVPASVSRLSWTGSLDLARDESPEVRTHDFAAWWSARDNAIIENVNDLVGPRADLEDRLRALGFVPEGQQTGDKLAFLKTSIDYEMTKRIPVLVPKLKPHQTLGVNAELAKLAEPVEMGGFERYVQRVAVHYEGGKPKDAYLLTYGWPLDGDGMNEDNIHWSEKYGVRHVLMNTTLEHSVAVPFSVNAHFAAQRRGG